MNKTVQSKAKYCIQSEKHPIQTTLGLCSLMEHQSLVDIAICCGSSILHAHKIVLAASSSLFREELERNPGIEQVIIGGCDFAVVRSLIEFMYCGETIISEDLIKYLVAAARLFQMRSLENLSMEYPFAGDIIMLPKPQFLSKKPKYPAYPFITNPSQAIAAKPTGYNANYKPHKVKRKFRLEAEHQACVKEAQASRLAIANLKKEIASAPQANTFIIEETCTETTVENFIPHHANPNFVDGDFNGVINSAAFPDPGKSNIIQLTLQNGLQGLTADKIKNILGNEANSNVEIMFKTNDGNFVTVTDEVLQNLQKDGLQYQVIDENGRMGELQELRLLSKDNVDKIDKLAEEDMPKDLSIRNDDGCQDINFKYFSASQVSEDPNELSIDHLESREPLDANFKYFSASQVNENSNALTIENLETLESGDSLVQDNSDDLSLNSQDMKPTFEVTQASLPEEFEVVPNFFPQMKSNASETSMTSEIDVVDDKAQLAEDLSLTSGKSEVGLKFSPDMFFADAEENSSEPDRKKMCLSRKK